MRLADCLNQSDFTNLQKIAKRHALSCPLYSKNTVLQEILSRFFEPHYVEQRVQHVSPHAQKALEQLVLDGRTSFVKEELTGLLKDVCGEAETERKIAVSVLSELIQEGFVFEHNSSSSVMYVCPDDVWKKLRENTYQILQSRVQKATMTPVFYRYDETAMARDAAVLLFFVAKQPIKLTQEGVIFKRSQQQITQLFEVSEEPLTPSNLWRFGYGRRYHDYAERFALLYDHLYGEGCLLEQEDGSLVVDKTRCDTYIKQSDEERAYHIFLYWIKTYRHAIKNIRRIVTQIAQVTGHEWVYAESLKAVIHGQMRDFYYESAEQVYELHVLQMLVYTGALMRGQGESGTSLYRLSKLGEKWLCNAISFEADDDSEKQDMEDSLAILSPNFEILVPVGGDAMYGWDLQTMADLVKNEKWRTYQLTRDSVYRALLAGFDQISIVAFLTRIAAYEVPSNVIKTITDWCNEYGKVRMEISCVVTARDDATALEIERVQALRDRMVQRIGDHAFLFRVDDEGVVLSVLRKLGFMVQFAGADAMVREIPEI